MSFNVRIKSLENERFEVLSVQSEAKFLIDRNNKYSLLDTHREGANFTIQSVGFDLVAIAMSLLYKKLKEIGYLEKHCYIIHTVHDSILIDCKKEYAEEVKGILKYCMGTPSKLLGFKLNFTADVGMALNWSDIKDD